MKRTSVLIALRALLALSASGFSRAAVADEDTDETLVVDSGGLLKDWSRAAYPEEALKAGLNGHVDVYFIVDESGAVSEAKAVNSSDPIFAEPAVEAVRRWKFEPALREGKPVPIGMRTAVVFSIAQAKSRKPEGLLPPYEEWPRACETIPSKAIYVPDPEYPNELTGRRIPGQVELEIVIGPNGRVNSSKVTLATHAAFVVEALRACDTWTFEPARQGLLAVASMKRSPATFESIDATAEDVCRANGIELDDPASVTDWPEPILMPEPVYPIERLTAGETGSVEATFTIDTEGRVQSFITRDRSAPEFGDALAAATEAWYFKPGSLNGQKVLTRVKIKWMFRVKDGGLLAQLAAKLHTGEIQSARGLDSPIKVVWRAQPVYPAALRIEKPEGDAQVEIVIDSDGRARLPRVVSATMPAFGLAAETALNQWVFSPPRRGGEPTEVRVRVPFHFAPGE